MDDQELVWEHITTTDGTELNAAVMEPTEEGWCCVAIQLAKGSSFENPFVTFDCKITITSGTGILWHDSRLKNFQPLAHYLLPQGSSFAFRRVWEDTLFALTWPP